MTIPSSRDLEQLSAYLDGQLSQSSRARLEIRIQSDPALASALEELRQTRTILRRTPQRRAPRNFTLTPGMAGIRPPVPRLVPVLSWASAVAMLFFIFTLGAGLVGQLSFGAAATSAAAPMVYGAGPLAAATVAPVIMAAPATMAPVVAAPAPLAPATAVPTSGSSNPPVANQTMLPAPTEQPSIMSVEQATPPPVARAFQSPSVPKAVHRPVDLWLFIWSGLAVLLGASAILAWGLNKRAFQRKNPRD
jgi:anti-sigma factor RsiW